MRKAISSVIMAASLLVLASPVFAQEAGQEDSCGWYWDYVLNKAGGWEWWCWSAEWGWWYAESEDGTKKRIAPKKTTFITS